MRKSRHELDRIGIDAAVRIRSVALSHALALTRSLGSSFPDKHLVAQPLGLVRSLSHARSAPSRPRHSHSLTRWCHPMESPMQRVTCRDSQIASRRKRYVVATGRWSGERRSNGFSCGDMSEVST